ncbi:class I SAM-dependent methyltransferase [Actinokineospora diospyrosa]|uniref:Methyltransferase domain-containing protein n=1 Tax=Actinokineospora diospyrosa TaxID=103728 RepID=A0ABT1IKQ6_9PSEU|nr:class I SAM-dependent methyltransferase [Actinokineospora diospyrosa]MCP2273234.1 Methyltransferase domain-containing protein [Actinokineospora diospyrosa]
MSYDILHTSARAPLFHRLFAEAFGSQWVPGVEATSSCTWWLLGNLVSSLRLPPNATLLDLGCGRGGPGLWLARALNCRLTGVDFSAVAIADATARASDFGVDATFQEVSFADLQLPPESADAAISIDAIYFAPDHAAAFAEVHRVLRPGAPFLFTARDTTADWPTVLADAGLTLESTTLNPGNGERWLRLYDLWEANEAALRADLGDEATDGLLEESADRARFDGSTYNLYLTRR